MDFFLVRSILFKESTKTLDSNRWLTSEISHHPSVKRGVATNATSPSHSRKLPCVSGQAQIALPASTNKKYNLAASLGVDQPLWSFLGANKNPIRPMYANEENEIIKACLIQQTRWFDV